MTNLDPKHLDALDAKLASQIGDDVQVIFNHEYLFKQAREAITALRAENDRLSNLWQIEHDHATALRAQIDRERAATIEAAAKMAWQHEFQPDYLMNAVMLFRAAAAIRALHTDATRAAMDAIWREGYEAGAVVERAKSADLANAARDLVDCCQLGEDADWEEGEDPLSELRAALAASIPPNPDANAG